MNTFQKLFSVTPNQIKENVIITPFLSPNLFRQNSNINSSKGLFFEVLNEEKFSVVRCGMGTVFVADAVLYLRQTRCKRVYFLGSCGSVSSLALGDVVVAQKVFAYESFTETISNKFAKTNVGPDRELIRNFQKYNKGKCKKVALATVCSLCLEEERVFPFKKNNIQVVDLEVSAFYSAAKYSGLSALAILYVTDIVKKKPFYRKFAPSDSELIRDSRTQAISMLCKYIQERSA